MSFGAKRKRQAATASPGQPDVGPIVHFGGHCWDPQPAAYKLEAGQAVLFAGEARVKVECGAVWMNGTILAAGQPSICICADAALGGPLIIEAIPSDIKIPRPLQAVVLAFSHSGSAEPSTSGDDLQPAWRLMHRGAAPVPAATCHELPPEWREAAAGISSEVMAASTGGRPAVVAVCGSRGAGKSTFARLLANALLSWAPRVAWLDTDLGQPEFTVPGLVSLTLLEHPIYGLPHAHRRTPARAHFLGHLSVEREPLAYAAAVQSLLTWHAQQASDAGRTTPLIVNTAGWIKGLGYDVLSDILRSAAPGHVIMLQTPNPRHNLPPEPFWVLPGPPSCAIQPAASHRILELPALPQTPDGAVGLPRRLPALEARNLAWLVWAHEIVGLPTSGVRWEAAAQTAAAEGLAACMPYIVCLDAVAVEVLDASVQQEHLGQVLNACIVGLAALSGNKAAPAECLGVGIVRAADMARGLLYVLTPLGADALQRVAVLQACPLINPQEFAPDATGCMWQVGKLELPPELQASGGVASPYLSSWSISTAGTGSGAIKSRNNLPRAAQAGL